MGLDLQVIKKGKHDTHGLWLFTIVKNEEYFLPFFLEHYKKIGVTNFVIYDDKSSDHTHEILQNEKNCTILGSKHLFGEKIEIGSQSIAFNDALKQSIHNAFFPENWGLYVDSDEFLILQDDKADLLELISDLEKEKQYHSFGPMVDFYPAKLSERNYDSSISPFDACPYFDRGPIFKWEYDKGIARTISGVRLRLKKMLLSTHPDEMRKIFSGQIFNPASVKTPLIKHGKGITRKGAHYTNITPSFAHQVALAHFKFYPGFDAKLSEALKNKQYHGGSIEYKFINLMIEKTSDQSLLSNETVKYEGPSSFTQAAIW